MFHVERPYVFCNALIFLEAACLTNENTPRNGRAWLPTNTVVPSTSFYFNLSNLRNFGSDSSDSNIVLFFCSHFYFIFSGSARVENGAEAQATRLGRVLGGVPRPQAIRRFGGRRTGRRGGGGGGWGGRGGQDRAETYCVREDARRDQRGEPVVDGARAHKVRYLPDTGQTRALSI